jgi:hypothetical protein
MAAYATFYFILHNIPSGGLFLLLHNDFIFKKILAIMLSPDIL